MTEQRKSGPVSAEQIMATWSPANRLLAEQLRVLIRELVPDVEENGHSVWGLIGYRNRRYFGFIGVKDKQVVLGFEFGSALPDPEGLLQGEGSQVRHVIIRDEDDVRLPAVSELIRLAAARALVV